MEIASWQIAAYGELKLCYLNLSSIALEVSDILPHLHNISNLQSKDEVKEEKKALKGSAYVKALKTTKATDNKAETHCIRSEVADWSYRCIVNAEI
ncbi:hypothetical protein Tco_1489130 [Tanacetum coccineum]